MRCSQMSKLMQEKTGEKEAKIVPSSSLGIPTPKANKLQMKKLLLKKLKIYLKKKSSSLIR